MLEVFRSTCRQSLRTETVSVGQLVAIDPDDPAWAPWISGPRPRLVPTGEVVDEGIDRPLQGVEAPVTVEREPRPGVPTIDLLEDDLRPLLDKANSKPKRTRKADPDAT